MRDMPVLLERADGIANDSTLFFYPEERSDEGSPVH
jgi:hypothetical protein